MSDCVVGLLFHVAFLIGIYLFRRRYNSFYGGKHVLICRYISFAGLFTLICLD